jgi:hypothetical protein
MRTHAVEGARHVAIIAEESIFLREVLALDVREELRPYAELSAIDHPGSIAMIDRKELIGILAAAFTDTTIAINDLHAQPMISRTSSGEFSPANDWIVLDELCPNGGLVSYLLWGLRLAARRGASADTILASSGV